MPPKKATAVADQALSSERSTARFVPIDGAQGAEVVPQSTAAAAANTTRPADESAVDTQSQGQDKDGGKDKDRDAVTIEDLALPKSIITRLAKGVLPPNTQIQANAILAMSKSATVFINYLASHANEHTFNAGKKTISPADVFKALDDIEFGFLKEPLEAEFAKFSALQAEKRNTYRKKSGPAKPEDADMTDASAPASAAAAAAAAAKNGLAATTDGAAEADEGQNRATKKQRVGDASVMGGSAGATGGSETEEEIDATMDEDRDEDDDDDDDDGAEEEEEEEEEDEEEREDSGDDTQDALEDRPRREDKDEALDGDDSD